VLEGLLAFDVVSSKIKSDTDTEDESAAGAVAHRWELTVAILADFGSMGLVLTNTLRLMRFDLGDNLEFMVSPVDAAGDDDPESGGSP